MQTIRDLLKRDLSRKIEEIIQVDQADEHSVYEEITEYVATDSIRQHYADLLKAIAEAPAEPHESVGVWVSGFFGSGKSSFVKNLGYALKNRKVLGSDFADLFKRQVDDPQVRHLIDFINTRYPTEVIMFDIAKEQDTRRVTQRIAEFIYAVVLRELDYAEDFDIAELEIELEAQGELDRFIAKCREIHNQEWRMVRKGAQRVSRASAVLHALYPSVYPSPDSWAHTQSERDASITVSKVVQRTFELFARRRPGKALVLVMDEVGQHVARSEDRIEDLRAVVEEFGKVGRNLVKAKKILAPCWIIVTSQEKLDEVVDALDSRRVELAKLQDRFRYRIDLAPSDIREVASKKVLAKKEQALPLLRKLYADNQGALNTAFRLERSSRQTSITEDSFIQFYPYPPHYVDLSISIMSGIRLQPGAPRHLGGSNRTIIKQAYEMLVSDRTRLADCPIGTLVTLDRVYELVEGNLSHERRRDIYEIQESFKDDPERHWILRVAKVICLLEYVRDLPRTEENIAAFLIDKVGDPKPLSQVQAAIKKLQAAQFIRNTEEGWKLQTAQEKSWETEKRGFAPKPRDRNEIVRQALVAIFASDLRIHRYKDYRSFHIGLSVDGAAGGDRGDIHLSLAVAADDSELPSKINEIRDESRQKGHENDVYWVLSLTSEIDELVTEIFASREMVKKYDQLRAHGKISSNEATCLQDERNLLSNHETRLREKLKEAVEHGTGLFRGVARDASSLGKNFSEIMKKFLDEIIPDLYPKLEIGARHLAGNEAEVFLKAADLKGLPSLFYDGEGLGLVIKEGSRYVPNPQATVAKEVLDYLNSQHEYGNRDACQGKAIENHFNGPPYGWERDLLRLILAVLFRAASIEISFSGQKFTSYLEPQSRDIFTNNNKFKSATFIPVKSVDLQTLTAAASAYESLTGRTVDLDPTAIATAVKTFAQEALEQIHPLTAQLQAHGVPIVPCLTSYQQNLEEMIRGSADDCVRLLRGGIKSLTEDRARIRELTQFLDQNGLALIKQARLAAADMARELQLAEADNGWDDKARQLKEVLHSETFYQEMGKIQTLTRTIADAYYDLYRKIHADRAAQYREAIDRIKGHREWEQLPESMRDVVLQPLVAGACEDDTLPESSLVCQSCHATISQMKADIEALGSRFGKVVTEIQRLTAPPEIKIKRVRVAEFLPSSLESAEQIKEALARLQDYLLKLLDEGVKIVLE